MTTQFSVNPTGKPWTRAMGNLELDLWRAQVRIGRGGSGGIESAAELAAKEGWAVSRARRVLRAGEDLGRFWYDMANGRWSWTPEFASGGEDERCAFHAGGNEGPCNSCER